MLKKVLIGQEGSTTHALCAFIFFKFGHHVET